MLNLNVIVEQCKFKRGQDYTPLKECQLFLQLPSKTSSTSGMEFLVGIFDFVVCDVCVYLRSSNIRMA